MRTISILSVIILLACSVHAQSPLDSIQLKPVRGPLTSYGALTAKTPVVLVCFWSVNIQSTIDELNAINKRYEQFKSFGAFKLLAISIDEGNQLNRMHSTANMNGWNFDVYGDVDGNLFKAVHAGELPQAFIIKNGQVVYQQAGFSSGTEDYLYSKIAALSR